MVHKCKLLRGSVGDPPQRRDREAAVKKMIIFLTLVLISGFIFSTNAFAYRYTRGYVRRSGSYVQPHYSSNPDGQRWNNWSSSGNTNPFTGKRGYRSW